MKITLTLKLPIRIIKKEGWFISCCPVLNVHSQGKTENRALTNLKEALKLFLTCCYEKGTLDAVFKEAGLMPLEKGKTKRLPKHFKNIDVPIPLQVLENFQIIQ